jgi:hypothetical protein
VVDGDRSHSPHAGLRRDDHGRLLDPGRPGSRREVAHARDRRRGKLPFLQETAQALADILPEGETRILEGQSHNVDPGILAPVLVEFFRE